MFVNPETGILNSNIILQILLNGQQVPLGLLSLSKFRIKLFNSVMDCSHFLHHLDVGSVIAVLHLWTVTSLLKSSL